MRLGELVENDKLFGKLKVEIEQVETSEEFDKEGVRASRIRNFREAKMKLTTS
jgi:hypothetical protein